VPGDPARLDELKLKIIKKLRRVANVLRNDQ